MEAWNQAWLSEEGRREWLVPEPFVVETIPLLQAAGVRRVLDLGFGVGRHAVLLAQAGFQVDGIDASANGLAYAQAWADREGVALRLTTGDMTNLPYADGEFDAIVTWNVIYHGTRAEVERAIGEITRCLRPQGHVVCSLISVNHHMAGRGVEIEPRTNVIPGGGEKEHPHHYFDRGDIDACFGDYALLRCEDATQKRADDYHWHLYATRR